MPNIYVVVTADKKYKKKVCRYILYIEYMIFKRNWNYKVVCGTQQMKRMNCVSESSDEKIEHAFHLVFLSNICISVVASNSKRSLRRKETDYNDKANTATYIIVIHSYTITSTSKNTSPRWPSMQRFWSGASVCELFASAVLCRFWHRTRANRALGHGWRILLHI